MSNRLSSLSPTETNRDHQRDVPPLRGAPRDWMADLDWLHEREEKILARICAEDSPGSRVSTKPSDRRARRQALLMIRRRIAELEAVGTGQVKKF